MKIKVKNTKNIFGEIKISGSKNASLPILVTSILTKEKLYLSNIPNIKDIEYMLEILKSIGVKVERNECLNEVILKRKRLKKKINSPYLNQIRASYYLMGAMFSEINVIKTKVPGGCNFEKRPIDYHIEAFKKMGAKIKIKNNEITIKRKKKIPVEITLKNKSLGTTINIILASVKTKGKTIINNASLEPEVLDFIQVLNKMNANIKIINEAIIINGVKKLNGTTHMVIPDRIEAGSYICLAAACEKSNLLLTNLYTYHLEEVINLFKKSGLNIFQEGKNLRIIKNSPVNNMKIIADNYPLFPTDLQQIIVSTLLTANNISIVKDNIYQNRFSEIFELLSMNANIYLRDNTLLICPSNLFGKEVYAKDLRAGFSLIIAGIIADKETIINHAEVILRGYENLIDKLRSINIDINIT